MSGSINKVTLLGHLGQDPEIRHSQSNQRIVHLSVATAQSWKDRDSGERRERVEWHRVVIFHEALAGIAERYLARGSRVYLEGALQTRKWQDQDGHDRLATEIVLQPYRGELVLLGDGRGSTSAGSGDEGAAGDHPDAAAPDEAGPA